LLKFKTPAKGRGLNNFYGVGTGAGIGAGAGAGVGGTGARPLLTNQNVTRPKTKRTITTMIIFLVLWSIFT
jgi:hypothetical protein